MVSKAGMKVRGETVEGRGKGGVCSEEDESGMEGVGVKCGDRGRKASGEGGSLVWNCICFQTEDGIRGTLVVLSHTTFQKSLVM